ncbi:MAG: hypothetical protein E7214_01905 [Clostridium sp.]|nr:hypothetical protein [Clostridium sp.]
MKEIVVRSIFTKMKVRVTYENLDRIKDGKNFEMGKTIAKNGKEAYCIKVKEGYSECDAVIEFLKSYLKEGKIKRINEIKIDEYIKQLRRNNKDKSYTDKSYTIQETMKGIDEIKEEDIKNEKVSKTDLGKGNSEMKTIIKFLTGNEGTWETFANNRKDDIFRIILNDGEMLERVMKELI